MTLVKVVCAFCGKKFLKTRGRVNESKKRGWKIYCSSNCQNKAKTKQRTYRCCNPDCNKTFKRTPRRISSTKTCYCSQSCAAFVNNKKYPRSHPKIKVCPVCGKKFFGPRKYCSQLCIFKTRVSKQQIIEGIRGFYRNNGRIPLKKESHHYRATRERFGSWNKAVKAAGFEPNPVRFAKKFIANDGHRCDSLAEKIIDDWFYARKIKHKINVSYPKDKSLTVDFLIKNYWIEFFGLDGELDSYDKLKKRKLKIAKEEKLKLVALYPKDLFPKSRLDKKLDFLI